MYAFLIVCNRYQEPPPPPTLPSQMYLSEIQDASENTGEATGI